MDTPLDTPPTLRYPLAPRPLGYLRVYSLDAAGISVRIYIYTGRVYRVSPREGAGGWGYPTRGIPYRG